MTRPHLLLFPLLLALVAGCEPPPGELVTCTQTWTCGDNVVADNSDRIAEGDVGHVFCTDPARVEERDADIAAYQSEFADGCDGVNLQCAENDDGLATCAAACVVGGACDIATAVRVRLE